MAHAYFLIVWILASLWETYSKALIFIWAATLSLGMLKLPTLDLA